MKLKDKIEKFILHANGKIIFLINLIEEHDELFLFFERLNEKSACKHLFVFFNIRIPDFIRKTSLNFELSENILSKRDYEAIDDYVFNNLSVVWYLYQDSTNYKNIQLGKIIEYEFQKYLIPRIKNLEVILKILEREEIKGIITIDDGNELSEAARLFRANFKIPVLENSWIRKNSFKELFIKLKNKLTFFFASLIDYYILSSFMKDNQKKEMVLVDTKLSSFVSNCIGSAELLHSLFEKGLRSRINFLKSGKIYFPLCNYNIWINAKQKKIYYKKVLKSLCLDQNFRNIFKYKNISVWEMILRKLQEFFLNDFPRVSLNIDLLMSLYSKNKIKLVILRHDTKELEKTVIYTSNLFNIPTLLLQHGVFALENGHHFIIADKVAVWGRASIERYKMFGNKLEKFEITGNPKFDVLKKWNPSIPKELFYKKLNLDLDKKTILFATQQISKFSSYWTDDLFIVMAKELIKVIRQLPNEQLIIKTDPYEDPSPYRRLKKYIHCDDVVVVTKMNIYDLLFFCDILITLDSTVALEAMIFDKPVIIFNLTKRQDRVAYAEKGAAIAVYNDEGLAPAIKKALSDKEINSQLKIGRDRFIEEYAYKLDGKAAERISSLIKEYIEN